MSRKIFSLLIAAVLCAATTAAAQQDVATFDLERLELNPSGVGSSVIGSGELLPASSFRSSVFSHYSHRPLALRINGERAGEAVFERLTLHLLRQYSLHQRVEFALQLPIVVYQSGQDLQSAGLPRLQTGGLSSPIVSARVALLRTMDGAPLDIAVQAASALPFGNAGAYARERGFTLMPRLLVSRRYIMPRAVPDFMLLAEVGGLLRPPAEFGDVKLHHQLHGNVAIATTKTDLRGELAFRSTWSPRLQSQSLELVGGPRYALTENIELIGLGSIGAGQAPGTPAFRFLFGLGYTEGVKITGYTPGPVQLPEPVEVVELSPPGPVEVVKKDPPKPEAATSAKPEAPKHGKLGGKIVDVDSGQPVAGALVSVEGIELPPVASDPKTGQYLTYDLKAGVAYVRVSHPNYEPQSHSVKIEAGKTATLALSLKSQVKLARFLLDVKAKGQMVAAKVSMKGARDVELALAGDAKKPTAAELPGGHYVVNVTAEGFLSQTREVQISEGGEMSLAFELTPEPKKRLVVVKEDKIQILQQVHFGTGNAKLAADSYLLLAQVVDAIVKSDIKRIRVEGHTDNRGNPLTNLRLSQARAQAVADVLVKAGIDPKRIEVNGYGGGKPIAPNMTAAGRERNRRVEFVILER